MYQLLSKSDKNAEYTEKNHLRPSSKNPQILCIEFQPNRSRNIQNQCAQTFRRLPTLWSTLSRICCKELLYHHWWKYDKQFNGRHSVTDGRTDAWPWSPRNTWHTCMNDSLLAVAVRCLSWSWHRGMSRSTPSGKQSVSRSFQWHVTPDSCIDAIPAALVSLVTSGWALHLSRDSFMTTNQCHSVVSYSDAKWGRAQRDRCCGQRWAYQTEITNQNLGTRRN